VYNTSKVSAIAYDRTGASGILAIVDLHHSLSAKLLVARHHFCYISLEHFNAMRRCYSYNCLQGLRHAYGFISMVPIDSCVVQCFEFFLAAPVILLRLSLPPVHEADFFSKTFESVRDSAFFYLLQRPRRA
jgi:hypothetical protein